MRGPKEKKERALGEHLHLKGERCASPKCALLRRPYRPGIHGKTPRRTLSDFGRQLQEKQKFKLTYGVRERALRRLFARARRQTGSTAEELVRLLERRLDNVVYRLGFAPSRSAARQLISHGHIMVGARRVRAANFLVRKGDAISLREASLRSAKFADVKEALKKHEAPAWLALDVEAMRGLVRALPEGEELRSPFETSLLVESFSK
jgi:small subunit ribosomal protein S4